MVSVNEPTTPMMPVGTDALLIFVNVTDCGELVLFKATSPRSRAVDVIEYGVVGLRPAL